MQVKISTKAYCIVRRNAFCFSAFGSRNEKSLVSMRTPWQFQARFFALWLCLPVLGVANIDSGGGRGTVGAYGNHDSIGSPFATDAGTVGAYANHPGLIEVIYPAAPALDPNADTDHDGLPDAWEVAHLGSITAAPGADADADGTTNLMEYLAGTDPAEQDRDGVPGDAHAVILPSRRPSAAAGRPRPSVASR